MTGFGSADGEAPSLQRRLKIAVLNRTFSSTGGGAERYSIALVEALASRHEIHVFAQQINHQWPGVSYHQVSMPFRKPRWVNQLWFATLTWWKTRQGFDIVHSHENTWHGQVQTVHVLPVKYNLFKGRGGFARVLRWAKVISSPRLLVYLWLERARFKPRIGRQVVVTSPSLQSIIARTYPETALISSVITPGVVLPGAQATPAERKSARAFWGLPAAAFCLLLVGNDYRKKGLPVLLAALGQLPESVVLAVAGSTEQVSSFEAQISSLGLAHRVFFLGSVKQMDAAYLAADCLVHPSLEDTFAMAVLEAMAHRLPVIVSNANYCGIAGLLADQENALLLADPRSASELVQAIDRVRTDRAFGDELGEAAFQFACGYQWSEIAKQQESVYQASAFNRQKR